MSYDRPSSGARLLVRPIAWAPTYARSHELRELNLLDACLGKAEVNVKQNSVGAFGNKHLGEMWAVELVCTITDPRQNGQSEDSSEVLDPVVKDLVV